MKNKNNRLYCFSPPVMLATVFVELGLFFYVLWRYKLTEVSRLVLLILIFLASFQLSEYMLCGGLGLTGVDWARFGYVAITLLPPLGLHLAVTLAKKREPWLVATAYASAAVFIYLFLFVGNSLDGTRCMPNYAVFSVDKTVVWMYFVYYYFWLLCTVSLSSKWSRKSKNKKQLTALSIGYMAFIIPTTIANIVKPETISAIPSVMCGFAVLLALALVGWVLPGTVKKR